MSSRSPPSVVSGDDDNMQLDDEEEGVLYTDDSGEYDFEEDRRAGMNYSYKKKSSRKRSNSKRRKEKPDRISALQDTVLLHIISFLGMEDAIKTHVLSKRWKYLWTFTPILDFSHSHYYHYHYPPHHRISKHGFVSFVKKSLVLCGSSNIRKFRVKFEYVSSNASNVDRWTRFAAENKVEELVLDLYDRLPGARFAYYDCYKLPQHLYSNSSITGLSLSLCEVVPNNGLINWRSLKNLSIGYVELSEELIHNMLLGSPLLESMELYCFRGIRSLNISSSSVRKLVIREYWCSRISDDENDDTRLDVSGPNLHCLEILGDLHRKKCKLINVPSLVEANLNFHLTTYVNIVGDDEEHQSLIRELLESLKHVPNLGLGQWCIQVLRTLETESLPSPSSKRKHLTLHTRIDKCDLPVTAYLLESSPYLETLVIKMDSPYTFVFGSRFIRDHNYDQTIFWTSQKRTSKCLVQHLRTVRIFNFVQGSCRFDFLKFLLQKARVLQRMTIHAPKPDCSSSRESFHSAQRLLSFPRSSPHAVVMLSE